MTYTVTDYKGYKIQQRTDIKSHCVSIFKGDDLVKMIAGDIAKDGSHNAEEKAKKYIDKW